MSKEVDQILRPGPWKKIHKNLGVKVPDIDDRPLGTHIECHAQLWPEKIALTYFDRDFSYGEINRFSNQLANALMTLGVKKGDVIGVQMPNIPDYILIFLAISKLGGTLSSISPLLTPTELARQVKDANIKTLFVLEDQAKTIANTLENLPACLTDIILSNPSDFINSKPLDLPNLKQITSHSFQEILALADIEFNQVELPPDHILLLQYTGGTTGPAKGAKLTLRGTMLNAPLTQVYEPWILGEEMTASALPLFHVAGMIKLIISLLYGARFLLIPNPRDIKHFCQQMIKFPPTRIGAVPTLYQQIADHPLSNQIDFSNLKFAMTGAAPITGEHRARIERMLQGIILSDSYGMTETGPAIVANPPARCKPEAVGIPLPGVDVRIVDVETGLKELPYGEAGEIIASTPCLMAGYLNRPTETSNAIYNWKGKTWIRTGDVGVMDEEGYIFLRDRTKDMINVSGFKVFSTEVENVLAELDCIAMSALIGSPDEKRPGSEIVTLYVELTENSKKRKEDDVRNEILEFCKNNLARYKIPKSIYFLDTIPLTAVGKIDKKVLRKKP